MVENSSKQRRLLNDRRWYSYTHHIPERRKGLDRRVKNDRRNTKRRLLILSDVLEWIYKLT